MQCTSIGAMVVVDSRTRNIHRLYLMIFPAVVPLNDAISMIHIKFDRLSLVQARELASLASCVLVKRGGKRKNKVDCKIR